MKSAIFIPYFGKLPDSFPLFAGSCGRNPWLDVYLFTDSSEIPYSIPSNLHVVQYKLETVASEVRTRLGLDVCLRRPYKLCDFKPLYAEIFHRFVEGYSWWGWGDIDVIYGDLPSQLSPGLTGSFQMVQTQGSLCLNRNNPFMHQLYRQQVAGALDYRKVLTDPVSYAFDETPGFKAIAAYHNVPVFRTAAIADIDATRHRLEIGSSYSCEVDYEAQLFVYRNGKIYREAWHEGQFLRREFGYIHLQKRKYGVPSQAVLDADAFAIGPDGFVPLDTDRPSAELMRKINPKRPWKDLRFRLAGPWRRWSRKRKEAALRAQWQAQQRGE